MNHIPLRRAKHARILTALVLVTSMLTVSTAQASASSAGGSAGETFQFSVLPGTDAWAALKTHQEMEAVTQVPESVMAKLTTDELLDVVLRYPLLREPILFNSVQNGFEIVAGRFNGLRELLARPDAATVLQRRYQAAEVAFAGDPNSQQAGDHSYDLWELEIILAQPQVLAKMSPDQLEATMRVGAAKFADKQANAGIYGQAGLEPTATLLGRALATREGWRWESSGLLTDARSLVPGALEGVFAMVRRHFIEPTKSHAIQSDQQAAQEAGLAVAPQDYGSTVHTPRGTAVSVIVRDWELSPSQITSNNNWAASNFPNARRLADSSRKYNCHSYAWYWNSSSNTRWMNSPGDDKYWQDGSYTMWHPPYVWFSHMKISYQHPNPPSDHSGNMINASNTVHSKWGEGPMMEHAWNYSPYPIGAGAIYTQGQGVNWYFGT